MNIEQLRGYIKNYPYSVTFYIDDEFITAAYHPIGKQMIEDKIFNLKWSRISWTHSGGELKVECWLDQIINQVATFYRIPPHEVTKDIIDSYNRSHDFQPRVFQCDEKPFIPNQKREAFRLEELNHQVNHKGSNNYCGFCRAEHIMKELEAKKNTITIDLNTWW